MHVDVLRTDQLALRSRSSRTRVSALPRTGGVAVTKPASRCSNQLLANLPLAVPGAVGLFPQLDAPISLA